ncbi:MAG: ABC transporter permease [Gemmatimonadota bacterium]
MAHRTPRRRLYRILLRLLPRDVREQWGRDMEEVFAHRLARDGGSPLRSVTVWIRAVADLLGHAAAERWAPRRGGKGGGWRMTGQDLRYAVRAVGRAPVFALAAVVTLALGIGSVTATFSVVHAVLLEELPYQAPDRLVMVWPEENYNKAMVASTLEAVPALESLSGYSVWDFTLTGEGEPREVKGVLVSAGHFELLGVEAALGRTFTPEEGEPGRAGVVVLSHGLWVRAFGADPDVLGRVLELSGAEYDRRTVVGIMPAGYDPLLGEGDLWVPLETDPSLSPEEDGSWFVNGRIGRLAPGIALEQAQEQVRAYALAIQARMPRLLDVEDARTATVQPLRTFVAQGLDRVLWVALGAVSLVLLIAAANVTNLLLARGEARARDIAVRSALGAPRRRMMRMLMAESGFLGGAGGILGVLLAYGLVHVLVRSAPADFPRIQEVDVDRAVLTFAVAVTLLATLVAGFVPAWRGSRANVVSSLGGGARGAGGRGSSRLNNTLVGAQVGLAVMVVVGSGLMLRSLHRRLEVDPGIRGEGVLTLHPNPPESRYTEASAYRQYYAEVLRRVGGLPGVRSVGAINLLPGTQSNWSFPTYPEDVDIAEDGTVPSVNFRGVVPGYFETVGIPLLRGRVLEAGDRTDAEAVLVVNEAFVKEFWPDGTALGKGVRVFSRTGAPYRVVGVVADVRQHSRKEEPRPELYVSYEQWGWGAIWSVDPDVPISGLDELAAVMGRSTGTTRFLALLLTGFGMLALCLGAVGVFGVTTYMVGRRTPELGVRIALGGSRISVLATALRGSLTPVLAGMLVGLLGAASTSGLLDSVLYGIEPTDPVTFAGVSLLLVGVATLATLLPAWRTTRRMDPVRVLNGD